MQYQKNVYFVQDRFTETLVPFIQLYIAPGSIYTDKWRAYNVCYIMKVIYILQ